MCLCWVWCGVAASIVQGAPDWLPAVVWFPSEAREITDLRGVETGSGALSASNSLGTGGSFLWGKVAGARISLVISIYCRVQDKRRLFAQLGNSSWRGA
jgi:hypothetical protein